MCRLNFLINRPGRKLRMLQAAYELLEERVDHLEILLRTATFPNSSSIERITKYIGHKVIIQTTTIQIIGTLVEVHSDHFEIRDEPGRLVMIPSSKIISLTFESD